LAERECGGDWRCVCLCVCVREMAASTALTPDLSPERDVETKRRRCSIVTRAPNVNLEFLQHLASLKVFEEMRWGSTTYADIMQGIVQRQEDEWRESDFAVACNKALRLVPVVWSPTRQPVFYMPKVIRYAGLCDMGYVELDLVASHPRQILRYATGHGLPSDELARAFGTAEAIEAYRSMIRVKLSELIGTMLPCGDAKAAINMICYGSSLKDWMAKRKIPRLPSELEALRDEVRSSCNHYWEHADADVRAACEAHRHPRLAALSVMCQVGERQDLDRAVELAKSMGCVPMGYLNDGFLCNPHFADRIDDLCRSMLAQSGVLLSPKGLPRSREEYFEFFRRKSGGVELKGAEIAATREMERRRSRLIAMSYFFDSARTSHCPDMHIARGMEEKIPLAYNPDTLQTEYYDSRSGHWKESGGEDIIRGEEMSRLLEEAYYPTRMQAVQTAEGKLKMEPVRCDWDSSRFGNTTFLRAVAAQAALMRSNEFQPLDHNEKIVCFNEPKLLDFGMESYPRQQLSQLGADLLQAEVDADALYREVMAPLRDTSIYDRSTRHTPHKWRSYDKSRELMRLVPLLLEAERQFATIERAKNDPTVSEDDPRRDLSQALKDRLEQEVVHHSMLQKVFWEGHRRDWFETLYCLKIVCNAINCKSDHRTEHVTWHDDTTGGTSKGTHRAAVEACLGTYTERKKQRGYSCVFKVDALMTRRDGGEAPSEQWSNLRLCKFAFCDDFTADARRPLHAKALHQITGGNLLTACRKHGREETFTFRGTPILLCNGMWQQDEAPTGADARRGTGQSFDVSFVDATEGQVLAPGEVAKDSTIKRFIDRDVPELFMLALIYFYIPQYREDSEVTLPRPPTADAFRRRFLDRPDDIQNVAQAFADKWLIVYQLSRECPSSARAIAEKLVNVGSTREQGVSVAVAHEALKKVKFDGEHITQSSKLIPRFGPRRKETVRVYHTSPSNYILTLKDDNEAETSTRCSEEEQSTAIVIDQFIAESLVVYTTSAQVPMTAREVIAELIHYASTRLQERLSENYARSALRERGYSSKNVNITGFGSRTARNMRALTTVGDPSLRILTCRLPSHRTSSKKTKIARRRKRLRNVTCAHVGCARKAFRASSSSEPSSSSALAAAPHPRRLCRLHGGGPRCRSQACSVYSTAPPADYMRRTLCWGCFVALHPGISKSKVRREQLVLAELDRRLPALSQSAIQQVQDCRIPGGCSLKRPDMLYVFSDRYVQIEVDEHGHGSYQCSDEDTRLEIIAADVGVPGLVLRIDPDRNGCVRRRRRRNGELVWEGDGLQFPRLMGEACGVVEDFLKQTTPSAIVKRHVV
jgi:hypothetical protein